MKKFIMHKKNFEDLLDEALIELAASEPSLSHISALIKDAKRLNIESGSKRKKPHVKHG